MEASRATARPAAVPLGTVLADYVTLTKPRVQLLLLLTTITTMYVAGHPSVGLVAITVLGGFLSAGGASAFNHYYDRDIDAAMARTATRPVPSGRVSPRAALSTALGCRPRRSRCWRWRSTCSRPASPWPGSSATRASTPSGSSAARRRTS